MTDQTQEKFQNLDLALIGNCRVAALVDRCARIVWWCFPRFDSDPVFSRLLAGDEEKGFCEVALADLVDSYAKYLRHTAVVETVLTDAGHGFRAAVRSFRAHFPAAADHPTHRAATRPAAHCNQGQADLQLRPSGR
jgi:hypothetical protein